ncbi:hypothetical protein BB561_000309 [Smittium simulii]|uniref:cytochrome-c oxidase n=1 Tax=Smittium simulii TaxID=133385 RepID=A0A2T9YZQ7_9FUNG|nr:hypothetical protein BB561_000321 [Smittium simulii]PVU97776.1 hypothetical protein BB561_000309 [Smittium simulii]
MKAPTGKKNNMKSNMFYKCLVQRKVPYIFNIQRIVYNNPIQQRHYHISNIRSIKRIGPHNEDVLSVIIGSLLGDGYGNKRSGEGYTSNLQPRQYTRTIKSKEALTVWIMDDGGRANYGLKIATNCLKLKEVELLKETLKSKYNLETTSLHQWYWSYEYSDYLDTKGETIGFDSFMIPTEDLEMGQFRLLEVDNSIIIPVHTHVRFVISSSDVMHSFAVPSFGIKTDAIPGRLNSVSVYPERKGSFYGQCSELCGVYHFAMPIKVEVTNLEDFLGFLSKV